MRVRWAMTTTTYVVISCQFVIAKMRHFGVLTTYRKPVLQGKVRDYVYTLIKETMESENIIIREMNGEADHIHILFDYAPDIRLSELINKNKSRTARLVRRDYPVEVGEYYEKIEFWTNSYSLVLSEVIQQRL